MLLHQVIWGWILTSYITGSPSSKYKHRRILALLRVTFETQGFVWEKNYHFCDLQKKRISIKKELTLHKTMCVTFLLCGLWADLWLFYGGVNGAYIVMESLTTKYYCSVGKHSAVRSRQHQDQRIQWLRLDWAKLANHCFVLYWVLKL